MTIPNTRARRIPTVPQITARMTEPTASPTTPWNTTTMLSECHILASDETLMVGFIGDELSEHLSIVVKLSSVWSGFACNSKRLFSQPAFQCTEEHLRTLFGIQYRISISISIWLLYCCVIILADQEHSCLGRFWGAIVPYFSSFIYFLVGLLVGT